MTRENGDQTIQSVTLHYPPGLSGLLSGVELCPEAQANAGTCGPNSQIGETIVSVGVGGEPFTVTGGKAYITGPYEGAPFGLSIVNPAKAGPFDLQEGRPVVVRAKIEVNPHHRGADGHDEHSGAGLCDPEHHRRVPVADPARERAGQPARVHVQPDELQQNRSHGHDLKRRRRQLPVSDPFQVTNCAALKFTPKFTVSTSGKTSKADGAGPRHEGHRAQRTRRAVRRTSRRSKSNSHCSSRRG